MADGEAHLSDLTRCRTARGACWRGQAARRAFEARVRESCRGGSGIFYLHISSTARRRLGVEQIRTTERRVKVGGLPQ
jgi:hypothetical protein